MLERTVYVSSASMFSKSTYVGRHVFRSLNQGAESSFCSWTALRLIFFADAGSIPSFHRHSCPSEEVVQGLRCQKYAGSAWLRAPAFPPRTPARPSPRPPRHLALLPGAPRRSPEDPAGRFWSECAVLYASRPKTPLGMKWRDAILLLAYDVRV